MSAARDPDPLGDPSGRRTHQVPQLVDAEFARLDGALADLVLAPTTTPWGNRSLLFRDPDGNLVNLFTPVTAEAPARIDG